MKNKTVAVRFPPNAYSVISGPGALSGNIHFSYAA
jgi:hypothetical protein